MTRKYLFCVLITILLIVIMIVTNNRNSHFSANKMAISDEIIYFDIEINSKYEALSIIREWLIENTDFTNGENDIVSIEKYRGYYEIRLERAVTIHGRIDGVIGYRDYVITRDGELKGYYMSK